MDFESFFRFTYGIYIISSADKGIRNGYIANTVFQVTAEPPQLAISCSKNNYTAGLIQSAGLFSVSVLHQQAHPDLIGTFGYKSGRETDKFRNARYITGRTGVPIVTEDALAWFECRVVKSHDLGTHILFIGEVEDCEVLDVPLPPMTYAWYREVRKGHSPKNAPTYVNPEREGKHPGTETKPGKFYRCLACNYIYDPAAGDTDGGIPPGTAFEDIPDDWMCPVCGATKDMFEEVI